MSHGVNAAVNPHEPPDPGTIGNGAKRHPEIDQLGRGDHAVLASRNRRDLRVQPPRFYG